MYSLPGNSQELPPNPTSTQYPLRPAVRTSPFRINIKRSLKLHSVAAIVAGLLTLGLGLAFVARHKPTYLATAKIYISPTFPKILTEDADHQRPYESFVQEHVHSIDQYDNLSEAIRRLPPGVWLNPGESMQSGVQRLQENLDVGRVGTTYQVEITLSGNRPENLAEIVNTITAVYLEKAKSEEFYGSGETLTTLKAERAKTEKERDDLLQQQASLSKELGVASIGEKGANNFDDQNSKLQTDLMAAHEKRIEAEAQLESLKSGDSSAPNSALNAAATEIIASDPGLMAAKTSLYQKRAVYADQLAGLTATNPVRKQTEDAIAQIDKELNSMETGLRNQAAARLEKKYSAQLDSAQRVESRLNGDLQHGTRQANDAAPRLQKAELLQAQLVSLQNHWAQVNDRINSLELESTSPGSIHLFSPAMTPLGPEKSKMKLLLLLIFPFSVIVGVLTAIALDLKDPHIYTGADVESVLGFAPVGMLFDDREVTQMIFDECALRLAAGIDHAARAGNARTFVITAVNSGAGTTSIIENLGSMLAKLGRKTLVIDPAGKSEPVAFVTFGAALERRPVHLGELNGGASGLPSLSSELQPLKPGRSSLPARVGPMQGLSSFVFDSFKAMSSEYDIVLIDAAPLLLSAETEYLARMADVTVLVSEAGRTKKAWLTRAARLLERLGVAGAAAIINKVDPARVDEAHQHDLREFELRNDKASLQDWWKPSRKNPMPDAEMPPSPIHSSRNSEGAARSSDRSPAGKASDHADEEDVMYARDL